MLCCMWFIVVIITRNYSVTTRLTRRYVATVSSTKFWFRILARFRLRGRSPQAMLYARWMCHVCLCRLHAMWRLVTCVCEHTYTISDRACFCCQTAAPRYFHRLGLGVRVSSNLSFIHSLACMPV